MSASTGNIRRHRKKWQVNWLDASGQRRWRSFTHKADALRYLREEQVAAEKAGAGLAPRVEPSRTWKELVELWKVRKKAKRSLKDDEGRIKNHLDPHLGGVLLVHIDSRLVTRIEMALHRRVERGAFSPSTSRKVLILLGSMLKMALRQGWIAQVPAVELPREKPKAYNWIRTDAEIRTFLEKAATERYPGLLELYATAVYTGMRAGELFGLQWADIDFEHGLITVQRSYDQPTKSNKIRRVPLPHALKPMLRAWAKRCHSPALVFPTERGTMQTPGPKVSNVLFHRVREAAELDRMTFHALRHTFASHYMLKGGDIYRLQKILGHSSVMVTERYAHLSPAAFDADRGRFGNLLPIARTPEADQMAGTRGSRSAQLAPDDRDK